MNIQIKEQLCVISFRFVMVHIIWVSLNSQTYKHLKIEYVYKNRYRLNSFKCTSPDQNITQNSMDPTQETNQETPITETECKKTQNTSPALTADEIYHKLQLDVNECLHKSKKSYQPYQIQNLLKRSNIRQLTDLHLHCLVIEIQTFFSQNKAIPAQMAVVRFYHEMIVHVERARTYISGVFPIMFVETLGNVKDENMFYFVKELKALYRIWHGYMDMYFLRKIRDQVNMSCRIDVMDIDLSDKYLCKELSKIKHSQYIAQKIIAGNTNGLFSHPMPNQKPHYKPKFSSWPKKNRSVKDETLSNQTNGVSEEKEKTETSLNESNANPTTYENQQVSNECRESETKNNVQQQENQAESKESKPEIVQQPKGSKKFNQSSQEQSKQEEKKIVENKKEGAEDKAAKLKEMYANMMMNKKKKVGSKLLVESGTWQFCEDIFQILKEKTYKKDIFRMIDKEIEEDDLEWIYPSDKLDRSRDENQCKPYEFVCKFCGSKLQALLDNKEQYLKNIVVFEMRKGVRRQPRQTPCFHLNKESNQAQGLFLLHKDCFEAVHKGKVDERKWKLE